MNEAEGKRCWVTVAALVPRVERKWHGRCLGSQHRPGDMAYRRTGKSAEGIVIKVKDAVQRHGNEDWAALTRSFRVVRKIKCWSRWRYCKSWIPLSPQCTVARIGGNYRSGSRSNENSVTQDGRIEWTLIVALSGKGHGTLNKAPALWQDPHSP